MHETDFGDTPIVDPRTTLCLGDGWHATMVVYPDGAVWPWLMDPDGAGDEGTVEGIWPPLHERLGPLPPVFEWRVEESMKLTQCQAITNTGERCSRTRTGKTMCWQHAKLEVQR